MSVKNLSLQSAQHAGRGHLSSGKNMQDALGTFKAWDFAAGVICDGCSEGLHSEAGAQMAASYLIGSIAEYQSYYWMNPETIAKRMDEKLKNYLSSLLYLAWFFEDGTKERAAYVQNHLLFTVMGFVWTPTQTAVFYAGDGTLLIDDEEEHLNMGDMPLYPAYRLIPYAIPPEIVIPEITVRVYDRPVRRLAIGSDAWKDERELIPRIWEAWHLQREINRLSNREHRFYDDVSIIALQAEYDEETS